MGKEIISSSTEAADDYVSYLVFYKSEPGNDAEYGPQRRPPSELYNNQTYKNIYAAWERERGVSLAAWIGLSNDSADAQDLLKDPGYAARTYTDWRDRFPDLSKTAFDKYFNEQYPKIDPVKLQASLDAQRKEKYGSWDTLKENQSVNANWFGARQSVNEAEIPPLNMADNYTSSWEISANSDFKNLSHGSREKYEIAIAANNIGEGEYERFVPDMNLRIYVTGDVPDIYAQLPKSGLSLASVNDGKTIHTLAGTDSAGNTMTAIIVPRQYVEDNKQGIAEYFNNYGKDIEPAIATDSKKPEYGDYLKSLKAANVDRLGDLPPPLPKNTEQQGLAKSESLTQHQ